jgi:uncharacterized protein
MKSSVVAACAGALFGAGLGVSGMVQPAKVIGFLDVFGRWDPSLVFVMMGALAVHFVLSRMIRRRGRPLFDSRFHVPTAKPVDRNLVLGSAVFGIGWGLGGFCPGPALVTMGSGSASAIVFVGAMALGMAIQHAVRAERTTGRT